MIDKTQIGKVIIKLKMSIKPGTSLVVDISDIQINSIAKLAVAQYSTIIKTAYKKCNKNNLVLVWVLFLMKNENIFHINSGASHMMMRSE